MLLEAHRLFSEGKYDQAVRILMDMLDDNPDSPDVLFMLSNILIDQDRKGLPRNLLARCLKYATRAEVWAQYGRCWDDSPEGWEKAEGCYQKALEIEPDCMVAKLNMANLELLRCRPKEAIKWANKALETAQGRNRQVAMGNIGMANLMLGNWETGWKHYAHILGDQVRPEENYSNLPQWDGTPGKTVIVYGEQGIGDEILYASVLPDMAKDCAVIYNTMPRLKGLMERSLPVTVCGDRWNESIVVPSQPDAVIPLAGVPIFYRNREEDFPGTAYLKPHEGMRAQMRGLLKSLGHKPKIGIAWTGGIKKTRGYLRSKTLEDLYSFLSLDATFISLQYKDCSEEIKAFEERRGIKIHHFNWITEAKDYDPTAALVSELDLVISVPTSVSQLAGALGVPCWVMVPETTGWLFKKPEYSWAKSVRLFHNASSAKIRKELERWLEKEKAA